MAFIWFVLVQEPPGHISDPGQKGEHKAELLLNRRRLRGAERLCSPALPGELLRNGARGCRAAQGGAGGAAAIAQGGPGPLPRQGGGAQRLWPPSPSPGPRHRFPSVDAPPSPPAPVPPPPAAILTPAIP